ncbi:hypothetical protein B296_00008938 [Ensete ventricosum]|uniref:Ribosomal protein L35Ae n=1 Tax=Ensete ventricosum TaxID=4639 RepID=A0A426ZKG9_ENSVE|nr:hypothetical protein B296_00008938 [Ensete ventricosum]
MLANASLNHSIHWVPMPPGQFDIAPRFLRICHPMLFRGLSMRKTGGCLIPGAIRFALRNQTSFFTPFRFHKVDFFLVALSFDLDCRLYVRGTILGYKRQVEFFSGIERVNTKEEVAWYCGKRMAYIYKAKTKTKGTRYRCIWGKVARPHGNSGVIRAKFNSNLPPKSMVRLKSLR